MPWMDFDTAYLFKEKYLKKEIKNPSFPYHSILDMVNISHIELVEGKRNIIRLR